MQIKIYPRGKVDSNFADEVFVRTNLMQCIYLFTAKEAEIVVNSRQSSSVVNYLGSFFTAPHKSASCLWLFPFPPYANFKKPLPLWSQEYNNYDKATYIVSFNLCLFNCPRPLTLHEIPTHRGILVEKYFSNSSPCFWS